MMSHLAIVLSLCAWTRVASADRHDVTGASFEAAASWKAQDAADHATLVYNVDGRFAIFVVYAPHITVGELASVFAADWKTATTATTPNLAAPRPTARTVAGRHALEGVAETTTDGTNVLADMLLLDVGGQIVPMLVYTQDRKMLATFRAELDMMIASIKVAAPAKPVAAPTPTPAAGGARVLPTVTLADIAGYWSTHDQQVTGYVDSGTGNYASTSVTASGEFYTIAADGS